MVAAALLVQSGFRAVRGPFLPSFFPSYLVTVCLSSNSFPPSSPSPPRTTGLIFGGLIEAALGWRYIFRLTAVLTSLIALGGAWALPRDTKHEGPKPALDFWGAGLGTGGLVTLVFCLSSGGIYGWGKVSDYLSLLLFPLPLCLLRRLTRLQLGLRATQAFIIALLALSVLALIGFTFAEKKVRNPLMPLSLWRAPNFGASWLCGLLLYCWWQSE